MENRLEDGKSDSSESLVIDSAAAIFEALDVNSDGFITCDDLAHALQNDMEECSIIFDYLDTENAGKVSFQQFVSVFDSLAVVAPNVSSSIKSSKSFKTTPRMHSLFDEVLYEAIPHNVASGVDELDRRLNLLDLDCQPDLKMENKFNDKNVSHSATRSIASSPFFNLENISNERFEATPDLQRIRRIQSQVIDTPYLSFYPQPGISPNNGDDNFATPKVTSIRVPNKDYWMQIFAELQSKNSQLLLKVKELSCDIDSLQHKNTQLKSANVNLLQLLKIEETERKSAERQLGILKNNKLANECFTARKIDFAAQTYCEGNLNTPNYSCDSCRDIILVNSSLSLSPIIQFSFAMDALPSFSTQKCINKIHKDFKYFKSWKNWLQKQI